MVENNYREYLVLAILKNMKEATTTEVTEAALGYISYSHCRKLLTDMSDDLVAEAGDIHTGGAPAVLYALTPQGKKVLRKHHKQLIRILGGK